MQILLSFIYDLRQNRCNVGLKHSRTCTIKGILWRCSPLPPKRKQERATLQLVKHVHHQVDRRRVAKQSITL